MCSQATPTLRALHLLTKTAPKQMIIGVLLRIVLRHSNDVQNVQEEHRDAKDLGDVKAVPAYESLDFLRQRVECSVDEEEIGRRAKCIQVKLINGCQ